MRNLLVGHSTNDDAAVLRVDGTRAIVQTVDFFTPIVDDPALFGAIAAANAISDVYAPGAAPILGLAIAAFPTDTLPLTVLEAILRGGAEKALEAGFPVAGGHTIIDEIPKYGLAVTGVVEVSQLVRNSTGRAGDALYLTKPIGNGILVCAHRALANGKMSKMFRRVAPPSLDEAIESMTQLNRDGAQAMVAAGVNAATDVTGYGLIGHLLEMCDGASVGAMIQTAAVPLFRQVRELLAKGYVPEGTKRNLESFRGRVDTSLAEIEVTLLCDAQTSGGLLIAVSPERAAHLEAELTARSVFHARIGELTERVGRIEMI